MNPLPTITEYTNWILEQCHDVLSSIEKGNIDDTKDLIQKIYDHVITLIHSIDIFKEDQIILLNKLQSNSEDNKYDLKQIILNMKEICCQITACKRKSLSLITTSSQFYKEEERVVLDRLQYASSFYKDQIDENACWFRNYFVGKPYITLFGPILDDENDLAIISIVKETSEQRSTCSQYRIIVRTYQDVNMYFIINESDATELMLQLVSTGQAYKLNSESESTTTMAITRKYQTLRRFSSTLISSQNQEIYSTNLMRAALLFLFQDIDLKLFKELSAEMTILSGLEKEFLKYDEISISKSYKFGLITVKDGQTTEEEWFSNTNLSESLERFLNIIGHPIKLKDYKGYAAGLDTKTGESGEISFVSSWKGREIMYHVAPLMPSRKNDLQQIHRKRYIGNDIVCIVFIEGKNERFDPDSIRSQFLHVFIIVYFETINDQDSWRIEVVYNKQVRSFPPPIPSPPIFYNENELRTFLLSKSISAENHSLKSEKFTSLNDKARLQLFENLITIGIRFSQVAQSFAGHNSDKKSGNCINTGRPKSAGAQQSFSHHKKSQEVIDLPPPPQSLTPDRPPISKSNIKNLTRRKNNGGQHPCSSTSLTTCKYIISNQKQETQSKQILDKTKEDNIEEKKHTEYDTEESHTAGSGINAVSSIRYKAHNLMNSMIGRRKYRTNTLHRSSPI